MKKKLKEKEWISNFSRIDIEELLIENKKYEINKLRLKFFTKKLFQLINSP